MISRKTQDVRLPSLSEVAGPDILSLDLKSASNSYTPMQYYSSTPLPGSRHRSSNSGFSSSNVNPSSSRLRSSLHGDSYNDPFALPQQYQGNMSMSPLSSLLPPEPVGSTIPRRPRKYSSSTSLRADFGNDSMMSMSSTLGPPSRGLSGSRGHLPPLPPLGSFSDLPPLPSYGFPPLNRSSKSGGLNTDLTTSTLPGAQTPFPQLSSMSLDLEQDWNGLNASARGTPSLTPSLSTFPGEAPRVGQSRSSGLSSSSGLKRRASTMNLNVGSARSGVGTGLGGLPTPVSPYPSASSGLGLGGGGLGTLPMPPVQRTGSRSVTGHIVLATDYRLVRLSQNISGWLGFSMTAAIGQPVSSLVAASDQAIFSDFLANLHAERRKAAEKSRLFSGLEGGEGPARGVSVTVNLTSGYGGSKPFVLTIWPVTRRMQGYQQAVLTGELIPAFADAFSPIQSVTPL